MANKHNPIKENWPRYLLEWGVLASMILFFTGLIRTEVPADPETYCPMGGLQAFVTYLVRGSLPCSMSTVQIMVGLVLAAGVVLFSKLFCGYVCPIGTVEDLLMKGRRSIGIAGITVRSGSVADKILRIIKYVALFFLFYMTATASELFCKQFDPYYATATGFHGETVLPMGITALSLVVIGGLFIDNFWCRYICPLGATCNTLKFWVWVAALFGIWYVLSLVGITVPWWVMLISFCLLGYILEVFVVHPKMQIISVRKNNHLCNSCRACTAACPYHINIHKMDSRVTHVDCTLCGDCVAACKRDALHIGALPKGHRNPFNLILPALLTVCLAVIAIHMGGKYEIPTIDEKWGIYSNDSLHTCLIDPDKLESCTIEGLKQVHCYGSSCAFMGKLQKIQGVYGVKTFVKSHKATILYDPSVTSPEKISEEIYVPSHFKCFTPDYKEVPMLKVITIRTENMPAASDVNFLGIQFKQVDSLIYGLDSQWDCPLVVRMYVDPSFDKDEKWIKSIVEKPSLDIARSDGTIKSTPVDFEFVRMEKEIGTIPTTEFLQNMFSNPFVYESAKRVEKYEGKPQYIYEIADEMFTKPLITKQLCFVSNHLSSNEGIIGVCTALNKDYVPSLQIRFAKPMNADKIWELLTMKEWTISYAADDVRKVPAKLIFKKPGTVYPYQK